MAERLTDRSLGERFRSLWTRCLVADSGPDTAPIFDLLIGHYSEPGRHYHSPRHVAHCLFEFDRAAKLIQEPDIVEMALWFHDVIYVPCAHDNEKRSADLFSQLGANCLEPSLVERVNELILISTHKSPPRNDQEAYLLDIDLSSFGIRWEDFLEDSKNVREEQVCVKDQDYYASHTRFLESLIHRPNIFYSAHFHALYEISARENIARLLQIIASEGKL